MILFYLGVLVASVVSLVTDNVFLLLVTLAAVFIAIFAETLKNE